MVAGKERKMMDATTMWVVGILTTIFTGAVWKAYDFILKARSEIQAIQLLLTSRPDFEYLSNEFYKKEVASLQFQSMNDKFNLIQGDIKEIRIDFKEIIVKLDKFMEKNNDSL